MTERYEILNPHELMGDVVLRAQTAATTAGDVNITIPAVTGGEPPNRARCRKCGESRDLDDLEVGMSIKVSGWESQYPGLWFKDGQPMVEPDWRDGPEDTDWEGEALYECDYCGAQHEFTFDAHLDYHEKQAVFGHEFAVAFELYYHDYDEEEEEEY